MFTYVCCNHGKKTCDRLRQRWNVYTSDLMIHPTWEYLMEFLKRQLPGLPLEESSKSTSKPQLTTTPKIKVPVHRAEDSRPSSCPVCKGPAHPLFQCETFKSWEHVKTHRQCWVDLTPSKIPPASASAGPVGGDTTLSSTD